MEKLKELVQKYAECLKTHGTDASYMCRPEWESQGAILPVDETEDVGGIIQPKNVIDAPKTCPAGQKLDSKGICRTVYRLPNASYV